mgnify:CR=1 FL=1
MADDIKPWSIRGVPPETRNAAVAAANREEMAVGAWLDRAIRSQVQADRKRQTAPVSVSDTLRLTRQTDLEEVQKVISMISELANAGSPPPKAIARQAYALLRGSLSDMKKEMSDRKAIVSDTDAEMSDRVSDTGA